MLRADLKAAGIPYCDRDGRVVDFHALRHTFVTNLARSGVHPTVAQRLARHSDVNLTLSRYTHTTLEAQGEAVRALPDTSGPADAAEATGTDGPDDLGSCFANSERLCQTLPDRARHMTGALEAPREAADLPEVIAGYEDTSEEGLARRGGFEPPTVGLEIRCSIP